MLNMKRENALSIAMGIGWFMKLFEDDSDITEFRYDLVNGQIQFRLLDIQYVMTLRKEEDTDDS